MNSLMCFLLHLRARLIASYEKQRSVHDSSSVQHRGHEDVVAGTVYEADVTHETVFETVHLEDVLLC